MQYTQQQIVQTCPSLRQHKPFGTTRPAQSRRSSCACARALEQQHFQVSQGMFQLGEGDQLTKSNSVKKGNTSLTLQTFPTDYPTAVRQAQNATLAAIADGHKLIEVEFPTSSLQGVSGDAEGCNEMTYSMGFLRQFCRSFQQNAAATRIFFPDKKEMEVAKTGKGIEEESGAVFDVTKFQLDYLTTPSGLLDIGIDLTKVDITTRTRPADELYIIAYPHFNVNEIIAVDELYQKIAKDAKSPIVVFNGELDRIRSGYYPALFFPKLGKLAKTFIPQFESAYYIHNFKGSKGGVLFRAYPDPWQVLRRHDSKLELIHTQETMPVLKDVALKILPAS